MDSNIIGLYVSCLFLAFLDKSETNSLPEQLHTRYIGCYGTHDFRPHCDTTDTVIAVLGTWVGTKPRAAGCPQETEVFNEVLIDALHKNVLVNETECCSPNFETDCIFPKADSDYVYQVRCTGLTNCSRASAVFWDQTQNSSCPYPYNGPYLPDTNYMFMEYYCIPKSRISEMTGIVAETPTLPHYIQNPGYPSNSTSGTTYTTCSVTSDNCDVSIYIYTIDIRLVSSGGVCKQGVSVIAENKTIFDWDCGSQTNFNITKQTAGYRHVIINFTNHVTENGGNLWIGFQASDGTQLRLNCPDSAPPDSDCNADPKSSPSSSEKSSTPIIIGAVVGVVVLAILVALCLLWYCVIRKRGKSGPTDENQNKIDQTKEEQERPNESVIPELSGVKSTALPPISHALLQTSRPPRNNSVPTSDINTLEYQQNRLPPIDSQTTTSERAEQSEKPKKAKKTKKEKKEKRRKSRTARITPETEDVILPNQTTPNNDQQDTAGLINGFTLHNQTTDQSSV